MKRDALREAIARVIDPWGWDPAVAKAWGEDTCEIHAAQALIKADAILALLQDQGERKGGRQTINQPQCGTASPDGEVCEPTRPAESEGGEP